MPNDSGRPDQYVRTVRHSYHWSSQLRNYGVKSGMKPRDMLIVMMLMTYARSDGSNAHPGEELLASVTGYGKDSVHKALADARKLGWIICTSAGNNLNKSDLKSNVWRLCIPSWVPLSDGEREAGEGAKLHVFDGKHRRQRQTGKLAEVALQEETAVTRTPELPPGVTGFNHRGEAIYGGNPYANRRQAAPHHPAAQRQHERMLRDEGNAEQGEDAGSENGPRYRSSYARAAS